jgi:hypothetical protein
MVHEKALFARAKERVHADTNEPVGGNAAQGVDAADVEAKLAELRLAVEEIGGQLHSSKEPNRKTTKDIER